jgi:nicotinamide-nucleotide amidase
LGANIGRDDEEIENVVVKLLIAKQKTLALAESCTGGIRIELPTCPGASGIFLGGVVSYANSAKGEFLGVRADARRRMAR